jgi:hypothetical protein
MNYQGILSQNQNLHRRTPHVTQYVHGRNPQVHSTYRDAQDTDSSGARTASLVQTSSNRFHPSMLSGYADGSILAAPETASGNVCEPSAHTYQLYNDTIHHHAHIHNEAYQSGTEPSQMQPQEDNDAFQMNLVHSTAGESQGNHWPQGDLPSGIYANIANADGPSEALNCQDRDTSCYGHLLSCNPTHKHHSQLFHSDPSPLASLPVHGAASTVVPQDPCCSLRSITNLVFFYPNMGYDSASGIYAVAANTRVTGSEAEIRDTVGSPMLNYHRTPSTQLLPLPLAEMTRHMSKGVEHPAGLEVSSNIGLESQQSVWNLLTGDLVPTRVKRSLSDVERAEGQMIRRLGGQCKKCRRNKRKVCLSLLYVLPGLSLSLEV